MKTFINKARSMKTLINFGLAISLLFAAVPAQANDNALLIFTTDQAGMQRVTHQNILASGIDLAGLRHSKFALLSNGQSVPIRTKGQNKQNGRTSLFGDGGFIEFYAAPADDLYNSKRAFILVYDRSQRVQIGVQNAKPSGAATVSDYQHTLEVENNAYYDYLSPSKTDPWHFGQVFSFQANPGTSVDFTLDGLVGSTADLSVNIYGIVDIQSDVNDHHVSASVNGLEVADEQFDGNVQHTMSASNVPVNEGANTFRMGLKPIAENPLDAVGLNKVTVRYQRAAQAQNNKLQGKFAVGEAEVGNLSEKATVYRMEADGGLTRLRRTKSKNGTVRFASTQAADYMVVGNSSYHTPQVQAFPELTDITSGSAEYLIISHANFLGASLDTLAQLRGEDYSVKIVDVEQIYAQFGDTLPSASAIAAYIQYAVANMQTRFVTLVGGDTLDYKNFGNTNSISFIPTLYEETPGGLLFIRQTPSDASYGDIDRDGVPDVAVGRLSVRTVEELQNVIAKIQAYEARVDYAGNILMAADQKDVGNGINFSDDVNAMIDAIPVSDWQNSVRVDYQALPDFDGGQAAHEKVMAAINAGVSVAAYIGHSSQKKWSRTSPAVFQASDIDDLTNVGKPTLVTQWGCWNTYFVDPAGNNMADKFLVGSTAGAATVLGASTLTTSSGERALGIELNKRMYLKGKPIGEAIIEAKQALAQSRAGVSDILLGWQIIGDPALVINP